jgi:hypothetical protein
MARAVILAVCALLLAGCAAAPTLPSPPGEAELDEYSSGQLDELWDVIAVAAPQPDVPRVEFTTADEWAETQAACLTAAGLPARSVSGGFTIDGYGALTPVQAVVAQWTCLKQYPVDPRENGYLGIDEILYAYDYFVDRLGPCLSLLGYDVPLPPDRLAYVGTLRTGMYWNPYDAVVATGATDEDWERVDARCPPLPDDPYRVLHPLRRESDGRSG